jgi:hypothetical protein
MPCKNLEFRAGFRVPAAVVWMKLCSLPELRLDVSAGGDGGGRVMSRSCREKAGSQIPRPCLDRSVGYLVLKKATIAVPSLAVKATL